MTQARLKVHASVAQQSVAQDLAQQYGVDLEYIIPTVTANCFGGGDDPRLSETSIIQLLVVAKTYSLNPFVGEIKGKIGPRGKVFPYIGIDGWAKIANRQTTFDGVEFKYSDREVTIPNINNTMFGAVLCPEWIEAHVYRKDRSKPTICREYLRECYRPSPEDSGNLSGWHWNSNPSRALRNKSFAQACKLAFSLVGIYDEEEIRDIAANDGGDRSSEAPAPQESASPSPEAEAKSLVESVAGQSRTTGAWAAGRQILKERCKGPYQKLALDLFDRAQSEAESSTPSSVTDQPESESESKTQAATSSQATRISSDFVLTQPSHSLHF